MLPAAPSDCIRAWSCDGVQNTLVVDEGEVCAVVGVSSTAVVGEGIGVGVGMIDEDCLLWNNK